MSVAKYCRKHIISGVKAASLDWNSRKLRDTLIPALRGQWTYCSEYGRVLARAAEIKEGKRPGSDLVVCDAEYIGVSIELLEVAMMEALSGTYPAVRLKFFFLHLPCCALEKIFFSHAVRLKFFFSHLGYPAVRLKFFFALALLCG